MNTAVSADEQRAISRVRGIAKQTAKIPPNLFIWAAGASIVASLAFQMRQARTTGIFGKVPSRAGQVSLFIGQWAPTFLLLALYAKTVRGPEHND